MARTLLQHRDSDGDAIDMKTLEVCPSPVLSLALECCFRAIAMLACVEVVCDCV